MRCHLQLFRFQNAEMSFNFGATPFKHEPVDGFVAFDKMPSAVEVPNSKAGSSSAPARKHIANAPQAIIIEVIDFLNRNLKIMVSHFRFYSPPVSWQSKRAIS